MEFHVDGLPEGEEILLEKMELAARACLSYVDRESSHAQISLSFVDKDEIHSLNRTYRGIDKETDVLSFPQFDSPSQFPPDTQEFILGDVVICWQIAEEQALEYHHSLERELMFLFVHSMFHLLGFDHQTPEQTQAMRIAEEDVLCRIGAERRLDHV